jgi:glucokinase
MTDQNDSAARGRPWLVGDLGATYLRLALAQPAGDGFRLSAETRMATAEFSGLEPALERYLAAAPARPVAAALAVAGPVLGDRVEITNTGWQWSTDALRARLGVERLLVLNDVEAQALALPHLAPADLRWIGGGAIVPGAPRAVLAPGSGLGVSALIEFDGRRAAIAGEGGHMSIAPETGVERDLASTLAARHGGHASWERVLSGPGLATIYGWIEARNGIAASGARPEDVQRWALAGDGLAGSALELFIALLGSFAGDVALAFGARGGVYLGGGIVPAMAAAIADGPFRARFEAKGRFADYLRAIPTAILVHPNPGLIGAAAGLAASAMREGAA